MDQNELYQLLECVNTASKNSNIPSNMFRHLVKNNLQLCTAVIDNASNGSSMIHFAAQKGQLLIVRVLVDNGIDVNLKNNQGQTAMYWAAHNNQVEMLQCLHIRSANVNLCDNLKDTPLHVAARRTHYDSVELLIGLGADIEAKNEDGNTALDIAKKGGHTRTIEVLVAAAVKLEESRKREQKVAEGPITIVPSTYVPQDKVASAKNNDAIVYLAKAAWKHLTSEEKVGVMRLVSSNEMVKIREAVGNDF